MNGTRRRWERGERNQVVAKNQQGREQVILGKHGGPVIRQAVTLTIEPKELRHA